MGLRTPNVLRFFGWSERRLSGNAAASSRDGRSGNGHEVTVAAELLSGGNLLQRACAAKYTVQHVRQIAVVLATALKQLAARGIESVDLSPWSLLYPPSPGPAASTSAAASSATVSGGTAAATPPLHENLSITNVCLGCHSRHKCAFASPHLTTFEAPELRDGANRTIASAMCTLGYVLHLLLAGSPRHDPTGGGASAGAGGAGSGGGSPSKKAPPKGLEHISVDAELAIAGLTRADPSARFSPAAFLRCAWLVEGDAAAAAAKLGGRVEAPLSRAHDELNAWYDAYLHDTLSARLELMREG